MKRLTLQWRVTILTAFVLILSVIALTFVSMMNAEHSFMPLVAAAAPQQVGSVLPGMEASVGADMSGGTAIQAEAAKRVFDLKSILFGILIALAGSVTVYFLAGKALRPLREFTRAVETMDEKTLSQRLSAPASHDEIGILTDRFNEMLTRLEDAFLRQKRFTANAAHELKTPLATMKTGIQVLSADQNADMIDYQNHAQQSLTSIDRLAHIVDDLLLLASAGEGLGSEKEEVWLDPLFDAIQSELAPHLEQQHMTLHADCGEMTVLGNPSLLYRIFFNLVENACKYGRPAGNIWITARKEDQTTILSVKDDGPGIGAEHLPYIFDAFYRVDQSRSREIGGSGLGLSLVKMMVEAEGGAIAADSDGKNGACFTVSLPE